MNFFLSNDFNILIEVTKAALFSRSIKYPPVPNEHGLANVLRCELRRPAKIGEACEVSVAFLGPWENVPIIPVLLWRTFNGHENKILSLQREGPFVTLRHHVLEPKPAIAVCTPWYKPGKEQWIITAKKDCRMLEEVATEKMLELVFRVHGQENIQNQLAENFKEFLGKTQFMFYDISFEFNFWGEPFNRPGIDLPVPWSTSRRLKKFLKHKLGRAESLGSAWISQDVSDEVMQPIDVTAVNYGIAGPGNCLPVWVLGPAGIPVPNFSTTLFKQLVCQAAEIPLDLATPDVPAGFPPPDICLAVPPQHKLSKRNHVLVIVMLLPIEHRNFVLHNELIQQFDAKASHYWEPIVETLREVIHHDSDIIEEVNNSIDAQDCMEDYLLDYLKEMHSRPKPLRYQLYRAPRAAHLPPKDSKYTLEQWEAMTEEEKEVARQEPIRTPPPLSPIGSESETEETSPESHHNEDLEEVEPIAKRLRFRNKPETLAGGSEQRNKNSASLDDSFETQLIADLEDSPTS